MQGHDINHAQTHLLQLVDAVADGETIIITKDGIPVAKLVRVTPPKRRGMLTGVKFNVEASDSQDAELADLFEGRA